MANKRALLDYGKTVAGEEYLEITDLPRLRTLLSDRLLCHFLRLFIWSDRLIALSVFADAAYHQKSEVARARDTHVAFLFACGALRELARAVEDLRVAGVEALLYDDKHVAALKELRVFVDRWSGQGIQPAARDKIAFHLDHPVLMAGLPQVHSIGARPFMLAVSDGPVRHQRRFRFAHDVAYAGFFEAMRGGGAPATTEEQQKVVDALVGPTVKDHMDVGSLIELLFSGAIGGAIRGRKPVPLPPPAKPPGAKEQVEKARQALREATNNRPGWNDAAPLADQITVLAAALKEAERRAKRMEKELAKLDQGTA